MHSRQRLLEDGAGDHALNLGFGDRHALSLHADMCGLGNAAWLLFLSLGMAFFSSRLGAEDLRLFCVEG